MTAWLEVPACPACGSERASRLPLPSGTYRFGDELVPFPPCGIDVATCRDCALSFKTLVPQPRFLAAVFARQAGRKWMEPFDFARESRAVGALEADSAPDLLDIGAGNGDLLRACATHRAVGRLSALDVVPHPGVARWVTGEFIAGFLDDTPLSWSHEPYRIVTLFDVLEHVYQPQAAFRNLRNLVRDGGYVLLETGDAASAWPRRYGLAEWWYVRLFEHHVFWTRNALEYSARRNGFEVCSFELVRHKTRRRFHPVRDTLDAVKVALYASAPGAYQPLAERLGKWWTQPWSPFTHDHFRALLRKH